MLGFVKKLKDKLAKTKNNIAEKVAEAVNLKVTVDEELLDELEEILIRSDIGIDVSVEIIDQLREDVQKKRLSDVSKVQGRLKEIMTNVMLHDYEGEANKINLKNRKPDIILFVGVNGVGKTTTIGKLASRYRNEGKKVMLIAGDTFRAAAIEQLTIWAERANVSIVKQQDGADPSSVVFDGVTSAVKNQYDVVLIDTAGRQHNKANLMKELFKIHKTIKKVIPEAPHETLLVIDATTGQNAISQTKLFNEMIPVTGLVLTKLDGTAKGGIVLGIKHQMQIPVKLIGVGEQIEDLRDFDAKEYVEAILED